MPDEPRSKAAKRHAVSFLARAKSALELRDDLNDAEALTIAALDHIRGARRQQQREEVTR